MAKIIPPYFKDDILSEAEKNIFNLLKDMDYDNCTVYHSLNLGKHLNKIFGEIDFVIICDRGILCLEVKGGKVYRENGIWKFENRFGKVNEKIEGPFEQVMGNMFSLRSYLKKELGKKHPLVRCQYASGVLFPDFKFDCKGPDIILEIIYDIRDRNNDISKYIHRVFDYWNTVTQERHNFIGGKLSKSQIKDAEKILRGNFACIPSIGNIAKEIDKKLIKLTDEQYNVFTMISENKRVIVKGSAGTGKTLLAVEHARRFSTIGKKVLFLCYNKVISSYVRYLLNTEFSNVDTNLIVSTFHEFISKYVYKNDKDYYSDSEFFENILPERFIKYVNSTDNSFEKYDIIIIDEGQDLLRSNYLLCIDEILKDGLANGSWYLFFDPNQNIYNPEFEVGYEFLKECNPVYLSLNVNCRNTKQIGMCNKLLTGLSIGNIMKIDGDDVKRETYKDNKDLQEKLLTLVKKLVREGFELDDIVIISPFSFINSGLEGKNIFEPLYELQDVSRVNYENISDGIIKFSTVQSFKGMESKVVILIDIEKFLDDNFKFINYTAISRARVLLYIFHKKDSIEELKSVVSYSVKKMKKYLDL